MIGVEVELARRGPQLPERPPFELDLPGAPGGTRMLWLGDSTAAGVGASAAEDTVPRLVAAAFGADTELVSRAVSGARVKDVVDRQLDGIDLADFDLVFLSVGANDAIHLTRRGEFYDAYQRLAGIGDRLVALGVPDMGSPTRFAQPLRAIAGWRGRSVDRTIRDVLRDHPGVTYVDIAGRTGPAFRRDPGRYFAADRFHPSDAGYRLWADAVLDTVEP